MLKFYQIANQSLHADAEDGPENRLVLGVGCWKIEVKYWERR
jgi:hypothetical protein